MKLYNLEEGYLVEKNVTEDIILDDTVWIDITNPSLKEKSLIETKFNIIIPTAAEIDDLEVSRRLYGEEDTHYMTAYILSSDDLGNYFESNSVRFILVQSILITVRFTEINPFIDVTKLEISEEESTGERVLLFLLRCIIYHFGDILEQISFAIESQTKSILHNNPANRGKKDDFRAILQNISTSGDVTSKAREGLISINRMITYIVQDEIFSKSLISQMTILAKDINALNDHTFFLSNQVNFLLEATLGLINIEQNISIRIFSMASMMFLPPTLIASVYGMNFSHIPGLSFKYGYIIAMFLMFLSAYIPYSYFKRKGWFGKSR